MSCSTSTVTVIVPNWNGLHWLKNCLDSLKNQDYGNFEIILVDDASTDGSPEYVEKHYPDIKILKRTRRGGFARAVNDGIAMASGEYVILLNNDTVASCTLIKNLVDAIDAMPPEIGSLACSMRTMDDPALMDDAGDILTWYGQALKRGHGKPAAEYRCKEDILSACAGAALYRHNYLQNIGGFDERFVSYLEDLDLGLRGRLSGYRCIFIPDAEILHKGHGSSIPSRDYVRLITRNRLLMFAKNIPFPLLVRHLPALLIGQLAFFIQYRHPGDSIVGYLSFLWGIPYAIRERRRILNGRILRDEEIDRLLINSPEGISLPEWLSGR
jgi:GT2 family glycosyltransferase